MVKKGYLVTILIFISCFLSTFPLQAESLPIHPKITKIEEKNMLINGVKMEMSRYEADLPALDAFQFYRDNLTAQGWKINFETQEQKPYIMALSNSKQEAISLNIYPKADAQQCSVVLTQSYGMMEPPQEGKDVPGKDLPWFNRYAGAVRNTDMEWDGGKVLVYVNKKADFELVVDFYRRQLVSSGWELKREKMVPAQNVLDILSGLPDNIKTEKEGLNDIRIEKQASLLFLRGKSMLLLSVAQVNGQIAATVNYVIDAQKGR